jgi:hypothetical protein
VISAGATIVAETPTTSVTVERSVSAGGVLSAKLNGISLVFQGDEAHAVVPSGRKNVLEWRVVGAAGTKFSIKVAEPSNADCSDSGTINASGKEAGACAFNS